MMKPLLERLKHGASAALDFTDPHLETCSHIAGGNIFALDSFEVPGLDCHIFSLPRNHAATGGDLFHVTVCGYRMKSKFLLVDTRGVRDAATVLASRLSEIMGRMAGQRDNTELLREINTQVYHENDTLPALASVMAATYNSHDASWTFAYAAHPGMLLQRDGEWSELRMDGGMTLPVGMLRESQYHQAIVSLQPGDRILMYSNGVIDTIAQGKPAIAIDSLLDLVTSTAQETAGPFFHALIERLVGINHGTDFDRDLTLMLIEHKGK